MNLILLAGGGHCRSCIDVIESEGKFQIKGILDAGLVKGSKVFGYPVLGGDEQIPKYIQESCFFLITLGQIKTAEPRKKMYLNLKRLKGQVATVISPSAQVSKHAAIGEGTIVMHQALVNAGARIGNNCIINSKALIEHDAQLSDHCHIATGATLNGGVKMEESCFVGSGAVVKQGVHIPARTFIQAQSFYRQEEEG